VPKLSRLGVEVEVSITPRAVFTVFKSEIRCASRDFLRVSAGFNIKTRAMDKIAIMAITIRSSRRVKPPSRFCVFNDKFMIVGFI
jgi:hypothetical protein